MNDSIASNMNYVNVCRQAATDQHLFDQFKSLPDYRMVLEHVDEFQGIEYLRLALQEPMVATSLHILQANDRLGSPVTFNYPPYGQFSPTTLRYAKVLGDLIREHLIGPNYDIVEIGGGYGGQCLVISRLFPFASYTMVDLEPCLALQERYLKEHNIENVRFLRPQDITGPQTSNLLISNYAFSECNRTTQHEYLRNLIQHSSNGYMTCNFVNDLFQLTSHTKSELLSLIPGSREIPEEPLTHPDNTILVW